MKTEDPYFDRADVREFWQWATYFRDSSYPAIVRHVAIEIWFHFRPGRMSANPSVARIAEKTGLSEKSVQRAIAFLKTVHACKITGGRGRNKGYTFKGVAPEKTLFELSEMLSQKPKTSARKPDSQSGFKAVKPDSQSKKPDCESDESILEAIMTDDDASARGLSEDFRFDLSLRSRLIEAAGHAIINPAESSHLASMARPRAWLTAGCDLDMDVLPAIRRVAAKCSPGAVRSWQYFEAEVMAAKAQRERPPEIPASGDNLRHIRPGSIRDAQAKAWAAIEELERKERERLREAACA